ncbi:MAG: translocation/assembly module TamB domain-containing protein, partial [Caulobacteraceae bacterium]|nr:translocation/assembly module TamB domain-containing protein [Caulobacteraceae bacterium]
AHGGLQATWSATQPKAGEPWAFTVDARGERLASGYGQLDRLLGAQPRLTAAARYDQGTVTVSKADLAGAAARAGLTGIIGKGGGLKMALDWSANGPFEAGPLEIAGKAAGTGGLRGTVAAPSADLAADFERIDLPSLSLKAAHLVLTLSGGQGSENQVALTAASDYGPAHAKAQFRFLGDGLSIEGLDAAGGGLTAAGALALHGHASSSANLALSIVPGAFLSRGRVDAKLVLIDAASGPTADLDLAAKDAAPRGATIVLTDARVTAAGPLARLPYALAADGVGAGAPFRLNGSGQAVQQGAGRTISFSGSGRIREADLRTLSPALFGLDGPNAAVKAQLSYGGGTADVAVRQSAGAVSGKAVLNGVDLTALGQDVVGRVTGEVSLDGQGPRLDGALNARLDGLRSRDAPSKLSLSGQVQARLSERKLSLDASVTGAQAGDKASVNLVLPVQASAAPFNFALSRDQPIDGAFDANAELQPIWDLFFGGDRTLGGHLVAQGRLGGTLASPHPVGRASLSGGRFEDAATGLKLRNLDADVDLHDEVLTVSKFAGDDARTGALNGQGRFSLAADGASNLTLTAKTFQLLDSDAAKATASGTLTVTRGGDGKALLAGQLIINRADISPVSARAPPGVTSMDVTEINGPDVGAQPPPPQAAGPAVGLDVRLRAPRGVFVKGLGLNAEMSLDAQVSGTTAAPVLSGTAHVVRGDYDLAGKRFEIDDQGVVYLASDINKIRLDLVAKLDDPSITAQINIAGTAAKPEITLSSVPALPSDEV